MQIKLIRTAYTEQGVFGTLVIGEYPFCITLERPWLDNQPNVSCIPTGTYGCKQISSPRFGETYKVLDVPKRTHILFHKGNRAQDSRGCILLGQYYGKINGDPAILNSAITVTSFMGDMSEQETFVLQVSALLC